LLEAGRGDEGDRLRLDAPEDEAEHARGWWVQPLEVVDGDDDALLLRKAREGSERSERDREAIDPPLRLGAQERDLEGAPLGRGQGGESPVEHWREHVGEAREREGRLRLGGLGAKDDAAAPLRSGDRLAPERGLARARLSLEQECRRPVLHLSEEALDELELGLAADYLLLGHRGVARLQE
jgi:hypothetical protein